jgi:hypothetical protein
MTAVTDLDQRAVVILAPISVRCHQSQGRPYRRPLDDGDPAVHDIRVYGPLPPRPSSSRIVRQARRTVGNDSRAAEWRSLSGSPCRSAGRSFETVGNDYRTLVRIVSPMVAGRSDRARAAVRSGDGGITLPASPAITIRQRSSGRWRTITARPPGSSAQWFAHYAPRATARRSGDRSRTVSRRYHGRHEGD